MTLGMISLLPLPVIHGLSVVVGEIVFRSHHSRRKITLRNLQACFPEKTDQEISVLARHHFHSLFYAILASGIAWWGSLRRMNRLTRYRNREIYDSILAEKKNIILLVPHFTGLEYGAVFMSSEHHLVSMYRTHQNPLINELIKFHRARFGMTQFSSKAPMKALIKSIRQGHPFYYLPDQDPGKNKGIFAPFFSISAATFPTLGKIAGMTGAAVVPCVTRLLPRGRGYEIIFNQPIANFPTGDERKDTRAMNTAIEQLIAHAPEQYFWSHRRFKTRPHGEPDFYA